MTSKRKQWHIDNTYRALIEERDNWQWQFDTATEVIAELRAENDGLRAAGDALAEALRELWLTGDRAPLRGAVATWQEALRG